MEITTVDPNASHDSAIDAGVIMAALHQQENIETVIVAGDFVELGSSCETPGQTVVSCGNDDTQVFEVINVKPNGGTTASSGVEVSVVPHAF